MTFALILLLVLALLLVVFTLQNTQTIDVNILFWTIKQIPLALTIFTCILMGIVVSMGIYIPKSWKQKSKIKMLSKEVDALKESIRQSEQKTISSEKMVKHPEGEIIASEGKQSIFDEDE
ncbi:MAG: lipopolysaccharide assembly LapA domain-containing protein [Mangrovibacterium sp.]